MAPHPERLVASAFAAAFGLSLLFGVVLRDQIACNMVEASGLAAIGPRMFADTHENSDLPGLVERANQRVADAFGPTSAKPFVIFSDSSFWRGDEQARTIVTPFRACIVIGSNPRSVESVSHELVRVEIARRAGFLQRQAQLPAWFEEGAAGQVDPVGASGEGKLAGAPPVDVTTLTTPDQFFNAPAETLALREAAARRQVAQLLERGGGLKTLYSKLDEVRRGASFTSAFHLSPTSEKPDIAEPSPKADASDGIARREETGSPGELNAAKLGEAEGAARQAAPPASKPSPPYAETPSPIPHEASDAQPASRAEAAGTNAPVTAPKRPEPESTANADAVPPSAMEAASPPASPPERGVPGPAQSAEPRQDTPASAPNATEPPEKTRPAAPAQPAPAAQLPRQSAPAQAASAPPDLPTGAIAPGHRARPSQHFSAMRLATYAPAPPRHVRPISARPTLTVRSDTQESFGPQVEIWRPQAAQWQAAAPRPLILTRRTFAEPSLWNKWAARKRFTWPVTGAAWTRRAGCFI